jgi:hypothetical protein
MDDNSEQSGIKIVNIDDGRTLTTEEIAELKRLVAMSKATKVVIWGIFGLFGALGADKVIDFLQSHVK